MSIKYLLLNTRSPRKCASIPKAAAISALFAVSGLASGAAIKLFDMHSEVLGNIFSGISVWVLICTAISVFSINPKRAAINVFLYCAGMIAAYYVFSELTDQYYSEKYVFGWSVFTLFTPIFAYIAWYGRGKGRLANPIAAGIVFFAVMAALLFGIYVFDVIFLAALIPVLLYKRK